MKLKVKIIILFTVCLVVLLGALIADKFMNNSYFVEINYNEVMEKIDNQETFILLISQTTCPHCSNFKPKLEKVAKDYKITVYYVEYNLFSEEEIKNFETYFSFDSTPLTIFLKNGKESSAATRIVGEHDIEYIIGKFKSNGFIE